MTLIQMPHQADLLTCRIVTEAALVTVLIVKQALMETKGCFIRIALVWAKFADELELGCSVPVLMRLNFPIQSSSVVTTRK